MKKSKRNSGFGNYFERQKKVVIARTEGTCLRAEACLRPARRGFAQAGATAQARQSHEIHFVRNDILGVPTYL